MKHSTKSVETINKELVAYFTERGWKSHIIFSVRFLLNKKFDFRLSTSYFDSSMNSNKICDWNVSTDKNNIIKYVHWFFEHVRPFWIKHKMGTNKIEVEHNESKNNYYITVNDNCVVTDISYPTDFS